MTPEQQIAVLIGVIAEKNKTIDDLRDELADANEAASRYNRWWNESNQEAAELRTALGDAGVKTNVQPI